MWKCGGVCGGGVRKQPSGMRRPIGHRWVWGWGPRRKERVCSLHTHTHTPAPRKEWLPLPSPLPCPSPLPSTHPLCRPTSPPLFSPLCFSRRAVERRKRRFYEEQEDALDRQREAQEGPMAKRQGAYHDTDNHERNGGDDGEVRRVGVACGSGYLFAPPFSFRTGGYGIRLRLSLFLSVTFYFRTNVAPLAL